MWMDRVWGIYSLCLSLAGCLHSHQHPEFSELNGFILQARDRLCALFLLLLFFYMNPSQMWTAVSLRLKTEEMGKYLSSFPQMNLPCQPSRHFCSLSSTLRYFLFVFFLHRFYSYFMQWSRGGELSHRVLVYHN